MTDTILRAVKYEAYFDLWGYSLAWIELIQKEVSNAFDSGDTCEDYRAIDAGVIATRFISEDKDKVDKLCKRINSLLNLARRKDVPR